MTFCPKGEASFFIKINEEVKRMDCPVKQMEMAELRQKFLSDLVLWRPRNKRSGIYDHTLKSYEVRDGSRADRKDTDLEGTDSEGEV